MHFGKTKKAADQPTSKSISIPPSNANRKNLNKQGYQYVSYQIHQNLAQNSCSNHMQRHQIKMQFPHHQHMSLFSQLCRKNSKIQRNEAEFTVQMSAGTRTITAIEQSQVYPTVKNTYLGTSGPEKYLRVRTTIPRVNGSEIK